MSSHKHLRDFYQRIVSIPNLFSDLHLKSKKTEELRSVLKEVITFLDKVQDTVDGVKDSIIRHAKSAYSHELMDRTAHLHTRVVWTFDNHLKQHVVTTATTGAIFVPNDSTTINYLRDFYHYLYYTTYYIGRYVLVSAGEFDISQHKEIQAALVEFQKGQASNVKFKDHLELAALVQTALDGLEKKRNDADYKFNEHVIAKLSEIQYIKGDFDNVQGLFNKSKTI